MDAHEVVRLNREILPTESFGPGSTPEGIADVVGNLSFLPYMFCEHCYF